MNKDTIHQTYQPIKPILVYKVTINKANNYLIILTVDFNEFRYVGGRNTSMNHTNHESVTTCQQL